MSETKNKNKPIPSLSGYGGVRALQKKLERSTTLAANKEAVSYSLLCISEQALQSIKSIKIDKTGQMQIEMFDKVGVLRILAKASGLLDNPEQSDKPSVIGINVKAPEVIDNEES